MRIEPNIPLSEKVADQLHASLRRDYPDGERLPGELELANEFEVSRSTIRQALAILEREGTVVRRQGAGTYANPHVLQIKVRAESGYEISELIRKAGFEPSIVHIEHRQEGASDKVAQKLGILPRAPVLVVSKLFLASGKPAVYVVDYIPVALIREPFEEHEFKPPIYAFLEKRCKLRVKYVLSELIPTIVEGEIKAVLRAGPCEALLQCDERSFSSDNHPIMFSQIVYKDDNIRFTVLRKY